MMKVIFDVVVLWCVFSLGQKQDPKKTLGGLHRQRFCLPDARVASKPERPLANAKMLNLTRRGSLANASSIMSASYWFHCSGGN